MADAIPFSSNSRTSMFQLHIKPREELVTKQLSPVALFKEAAERNIGHLEPQYEILKEAGLVKNGLAPFFNIIGRWR